DAGDGTPGRVVDPAADEAIGRVAQAGRLDVVEVGAVDLSLVVARNFHRTRGGCQAAEDHRTCEHHVDAKSIWRAGKREPLSRRKRLAESGARRRTAIEGVRRGPESDAESSQLQAIDLTVDAHSG